MLILFKLRLQDADFKVLQILQTLGIGSLTAGLHKSRNKFK